MTYFEIFRTRELARAKAREMRSTGWPRARADSLDATAPDGGPATVWVVAAEPNAQGTTTYLRADGYVR